MAPVGKLYVTVESASVSKQEAASWAKLQTASLKVEVRDGSSVQKDKTKQVTRVQTADGGFTVTYDQPLSFDVTAGYPGELRLQLCRVKNNGLTGGTLPVANAGIYVKNLISYIEQSKTGLNKRFTLFAKDNGGPAGVVTLRLTYAPVGGKPYPVPAQVKDAMHVNGTSATAAASSSSVTGGTSAAVAGGAAASTTNDGLEDHRLTDDNTDGGPVAIIVGVGLLAVAGAIAAFVLTGKPAQQKAGNAPSASAKKSK